MTRRLPRLAPLPRSRREWAKAADTAEMQHLAGQLELKVDETGGCTALFLSLGPRFYVRRVFDRFARQRGFTVTSVRREPPPLVSPLTGELNHCYVIRLERRQ